jgi:hypothetical protein
LVTRGDTPSLLDKRPIADGGVIGAGDPGSQLQGKVIVWGGSVHTPGERVEGAIDSLLDVVFDHPENKVNHEAILKLHHFGGGGGVKDNALKELKEIE